MASLAHELRPEEVAAAACVQGVLGGQVVPKDVPGAPSGTNDFDLLVDGKTLAFEVTRAVDGRQIGTRSAIDRLDWATPDLRESWWLVVESRLRERQPDVRRLHSEAPRLLQQIEAENVADFRCQMNYFRANEYAGDDADPSLTEARMQPLRRFSDLGVVAGRVLPADGKPPTILVGLSGGFGTTPDLINTAALEAIGPNVAKLLKGKGDERHVFAWVDTSASDIELALHLGHVPPPPALPTGIDAVWLARLTIGGDWDSGASSVWRAADCGWVKIR